MVIVHLKYIQYMYLCGVHVIYLYADSDKNVKQTRHDQIVAVHVQENMCRPIHFNCMKFDNL